MVETISGAVYDYMRWHPNLSSDYTVSRIEGLEHHGDALSVAQIRRALRHLESLGLVVTFESEEKFYRRVDA